MRHIKRHIITNKGEDIICTKEIHETDDKWWYLKLTGLGMWFQTGWYIDIERNIPFKIW